MSESLVDLDSLNAKQKGKEYKSAQKDVKSKDLAVKNAAMAKLHDVRYYTEGGCFVPLVNSCLPKKKTMDVSKLCLDQLLKFLDSKQDDSIIACLRLTVGSEGKLDLLKVLSDAMNFREEIKKPKKKKSKNSPAEEEEVIPEDPQYEGIRRCALKSIYLITRTLHSEPEKLKDLQNAVANVPDLVGSVTSVILAIKKDIKSETVDARAKAVQDGIYALMILVFALRHSPENSLAFCKNELLSHLAELSAEKKFTLYCIQILEILSTFKEGVILLSSSDHQQLLMELISGASKQLNEAADEVPATNAKDKGKKEPPPKKGAPVPEVIEDPMDKLDFIVVPAPRAAVAAVKLISKIFITIGTLPSATLETATVHDLSAILSKSMLNNATYEVIRSAHQAPFDEQLGDAVDSMCIAVGTLGLRCGAVRRATYESGALSASMTVLQNSLSIVAGPPPAAAAASAGGKGAPVVEAPPPLSSEEQRKQDLRLVQLRRVAEKAVLNLITESLDSPLDDALAGHVSHGIDLPVRWTSCFARKSDDAAFDAGDATLGEKLVAMLSVANDDDLANRGVRIFAAILHGHHHPVELIESKGLLKTVIKPLSQVVQARGARLVKTEIENDIKNAALAAKMAVEAAVAAATETEAQELKNDASEGKSDENTAEHDIDVAEITATAASISLSETPSVSAGPTAATTATTAAASNITPQLTVAEDSSAAVYSSESVPQTEDVLIPAVSETFFLALSVVELFLLASPDTVNIFATAERVELLADLLRALGPVSNTQGTRPACGISEKTCEYVAILHDPRRHNWSSLNPSSYYDNVEVRPLILDVLSLSAAAGQKYRTYEGELPAAPCTPVPPSQSPCEEAALFTCKFSADACCAILLSQANLTWTPSPTGVHLNVKPDRVRNLSHAVQDAALSLLRNIAKSGVRGVAGAIAAIAASGFAFGEAHLSDVNLTNVDDIDMAHASQAVQQGRCGMRDLLHTLRLIGSTADDTVTNDYSMVVPEGFTWTRPAFFDEVFPSNDALLTTQEQLPVNPQLWPYIVFCGAFMATLSNPSTSRSAAALTLDALSAVVRIPVLEDSSQPVVTDVMAAVFLSLGGGVILSGLLSRFGNLNDEVKTTGMELARYLFSRGHSRRAFWTEWELSHREEIPIDPKTGKPIPKKEEKKKDAKAEKKKDPKAPAEVPSCIPEVELNFESTEAFPDPNHGPNEELWVKLLDVFADDLHEQCPATSALISAVQGSLTELAVFLINQGAALDFCDGTFHTALMYALLLSDKDVVEILITKNANFDTLDNERNPTVKYAVLSLSEEEINRVLTGHNHALVTVESAAAGGTNGTDSNQEVIELLGHPTLLQTLIKSSMDFEVSGPYGLSPIMMGLGLGEITVFIGGYRLHILNASYNSPHASIEQVHLDVEALIKDGANVNFCNIDGVVPLHIAAARGDLKLMEALLRHDAIPNALDYAGFLPLHYLAACCPENAIAGFDLLLKYSSNRHLERMEFSDSRTCVGAEEKAAIDFDRFLAKAFTEAISPSVIGKKRLSPSEILHQCTDANMNMLKLCFSAPVLLADVAQLKSLINFDKTSRMTLALHIIQTTERTSGDNTAHAILSHVDESTGFSTLHAASLLFQGMTPQIFLTDREKRAKRVRKFVSDEARLLDYIYACMDPTDTTVFNATCAIPLPALCLETWSLMHPAVFWDNPELASSLLQKGFLLDDTEIVHFLAEKCPKASEQLVRVIVDAAVASPKSKVLLNDRGSLYGNPSRPLHIAVRTRNLNLVTALAACVKVDLNAIDELTGKTALHEACEIGSVDLVKAFVPGSDRLDLFAGSNNASDCGTLRTPLNVALDALDISIVQELVFMRKNDVIQQLLQICSSSTATAAEEKDALHNSDTAQTAQTANTLLLALEKQNAEMAERLGVQVLATSALSSPPQPQLSAKQPAVQSEGGEAVVGDGTGDGIDAVASSKHGSERGGDDHVAEEEAIEEPTDETQQEGERKGVDGEAIVDAAVVNQSESLEDLDVIAQSGIGGKALVERKRSFMQFSKSNEVLSVLIDLVNSSGIVSESDHLHPYYFTGALVDK